MLQLFRVKVMLASFKWQWGDGEKWDAGWWMGFWVKQRGLADELAESDMRNEREEADSNMTLNSSLNWVKGDTIN